MKTEQIALIVVVAGAFLLHQSQQKKKAAEEAARRQSAPTPQQQIGGFMQQTGGFLQNVGGLAGAITAGINQVIHLTGSSGGSTAAGSSVDDRTQSSSVGDYSTITPDVVSA